MSNKIFQTSINFMEQFIFDKLVDKLRFKKKQKENAASGYFDGELVTIYHEGEQITIIIPDDNLSEEQCQRLAKKILIELYKLKGIELEIDDIEVEMLGFASGICNYCLIKAFTHKCRRCKGYYCSEHRLPEYHDCPGERKLEFKIKEIEKTKDKAEKDEKSKKVIILESHCG